MTEEKRLSASDLARTLVGDGKSPNKYFVTIGYGWYQPEDDEADMKQVPDALKPITIYCASRYEAEGIFNAIELPAIAKVTGRTISEVIIEDRKTGVIKQKYYQKRGDTFRGVSY